MGAWDDDLHASTFSPPLFPARPLSCGCLHRVSGRITALTSGGRPRACCTAPWGAAAWRGSWGYWTYVHPTAAAPSSWRSSRTAPPSPSSRGAHWQPPSSAACACREQQQQTWWCLARRRPRAPRRPRRPRRSPSTAPSPWRTRCALPPCQMAGAGVHGGQLASQQRGGFGGVVSPSPSSPPPRCRQSQLGSISGAREIGAQGNDGAAEPEECQCH